MQKLAHIGVRVTDLEKSEGPDGESLEFCSKIQIDPA